MKFIFKEDKEFGGGILCFQPKIGTFLIPSSEIIPQKFRPNRLIITIYYFLRKIKIIANKVVFYFLLVKKPFEDGHI